VSTNNGMPELEIEFKGLGVSAIKRGERGAAALILIDDTAPDGGYAKYKTIEDFSSEEQAKYTEENQAIIKDAMAGVPLVLYVFKLKTDGVLTDLLKIIGGTIPNNCWIGIVSETGSNHTDLATWIKAKNKLGKRYKGFVYKATSTDDMHVVNFANDNVTFGDTRGKLPAWKAIGYLVGYLAGLSLNMSAIAKTLDVLENVDEPDDLDKEISEGKFILFNDEGVVKVARGVNSLVTLGQNITEEMTQINTVEKMDLIYVDIFNTWNNGYKGKYPNILDNQMLFISAIDGYYQGLAKSYILDPNFDNKAEVDIEAQRLANYPKYGKEVVEGWDDMKAIQMTVGTKVLFKSNVKISGIMEDFYFDIYM